MQDLQVKTHAGKEASLSADTIEKLRQSIRGKVLTRESENYD